MGCEDECPCGFAGQRQHLADLAVNGLVGLLNCVPESMAVAVIKRGRRVHLAPEVMARAVGGREGAKHHIPLTGGHQPPEDLTVRGNASKDVPPQLAKRPNTLVVPFAVTDRMVAESILNLAQQRRRTGYRTALVVVGAPVHQVKAVRYLPEP